MGVGEQRSGRFVPIFVLLLLCVLLFCVCVFGIINQENNKKQKQPLHLLKNVK